MLLVATAGSACLAEQSGKPNIVFFYIDDLGWTDLGSYGSEIETPNLDKRTHEVVSTPSRIKSSP